MTTFYFAIRNWVALTQVLIKYVTICCVSSNAGYHFSIYLDVVLTWWLIIFYVEAIRLWISVVRMYILQSSQDEKCKPTITGGGNRNKTFTKYWIMCHIEVVMVPQKCECNLRSLGREWGNLTYQWYLQTEAPSWCSGFLVSSRVEHWWKKILWRFFIYSSNNSA